MTATVVGPDVFVLLIPLAILGLVVWAIVDVAQRPSSALSTRAKTAWIIGLVVGTLLFGIVGVIIALVYLVAVRPRLTRSG